MHAAAGGRNASGPGLTRYVVLMALTPQVQLTRDCSTLFRVESTRREGRSREGKRPSRDENARSLGLNNSSRARVVRPEPVHGQGTDTRDPFELAIDGPQIDIPFHRSSRDHEIGERNR